MNAKSNLRRALGDINFVKFFLFDVLVATIAGLVAGLLSHEMLESLLISLVVGSILLIAEARLQLIVLKSELISAVGIHEGILKDPFLLDSVEQLTTGYGSIREAGDSFLLTHAEELISQCTEKMTRLAEGVIHAQPEEAYHLIVALWKQTQHDMFATIFAKTADYWFPRGGGKQVLTENLKAIERGVRCTRVFIVEGIEDLTEPIRALIRSQAESGINVKIVFADNLSSDVLVDMGLFDEKYVELMDLVPGSEEIRGGTFYANKEGIRRAKFIRDRILQESEDALEVLGRLS